MAKAYTNLSQSQYQVRVVKNEFITVSDGTRLAADLYLPEGKEKSPAILVKTPYHKDSIQFYGGKHKRDMWFFAQRGYAGILVDLRGTGASEGSNPYYFNNREWQDGYDLVEWTADQVWCNGLVGMHGQSYGGILAARIAAEQPPSLMAISATACFSNIYGDHFRPGGTRCAAPFAWISGPDNVTRTYILPPKYDDPRFPGRLEALWLQHLNENGWMETLEKDWHHTEYDAYWQERDLISKFHEIKVPVLLANGWFDHVRNMDQAILAYQALKKNTIPLKLIMYPYSHKLPAGTYEFDLLTTELAWFDHFLKDRDTGIVDEDPVSIFVMGANRWRSEKDWPLERVKNTAMYFQADGTLADKATAEATNGTNEKRGFVYCPETGKAAGPDGIVPNFEYPKDGFRVQEDQRVDETGLSFTGDLLEADIEITGMAEVFLRGSSTARDANFCIKLLDVHPDGHSEMISRGWINTAHFKSNLNPKRIEDWRYEKPVPVSPGQAVDLYVTLHNTSYVFKKGHRIRVSITGSDWPHIWPTPELGEHFVHFDPDYLPRIVLPVAPPPADWEEPFIPEARPLTEIPGFQPPPPLKGSEHYIIADNPDENIVRYGGEKIQHLQQDPNQQTKYENEWTIYLPKDDPGKQRIEYHNTYLAQRRGKPTLEYIFDYSVDLEKGPRMSLVAKIDNQVVYTKSSEDKK